jgi:hypothetical protein
VPLCADGLGNIRDERLFQTWKKEKKVKWLRPEQSADEWFNMFVLHQNRIGTRAGLPARARGLCACCEAERLSHWLVFATRSPRR